MSETNKRSLYLSLMDADPILVRGIVTPWRYIIS
uniref:Uncharacterized protein n=1 Tax=Anguilla anguilla TaxID=7936 RepID=A0A0E9VXM4_ANGAN